MYNLVESKDLIRSWIQIRNDYSASYLVRIHNIADKF
jgi:hypothetical protein